MLLLRTRYMPIGTGSPSNNILNFKLVRLEVKLFHEKILILRCILPPPKKKN